VDCSWCGLGLPANMEGVVIDHIIPRARGGPNVGWNKQLLHALCNARKQDKLTPEAEALALARGVKLHEPNGRLRHQLRRRKPYTTKPEVRELKRLAALPPSLAELQAAIDAVLQPSPPMPPKPGAQWVAAEMRRRQNRKD
jgi:HNH endonuclease